MNIQSLPRAACPLVLALWISPVRGEEPTKVNIHSRTETYAYASDSINSIVLNPVLFTTPVIPLFQAASSFLESLATGCRRADWWQLDLATSLSSGDNLNLNFGSTMQAIAGTAGSFGVSGVSINDAITTLIPQVSPCGPTDVQTRLGGTTSVYTRHAGTGPYTAKINSGDFLVTRTVMIRNPSAEPIELPIHISGSGTAAVSLGPDVTTYAYAKLRIHGSVAGQAFDESIMADGAAGFPDVRSIDVTRRFVVAPAASTTQVSYDVRGEFEVSVKAKGIGFFGLITQSATAQVDFPHTLAIQNFTGQNGGPLPPNVIIMVPEESGAVLVDTTLYLHIAGESSGNLDLRIHGPAGRAVQLEHSESLTEWNPLGQPFVLPSTASSRQIPIPSVGKGFLRMSCE